VPQLVPVYRKYQPTWISPCMLGDPCPSCLYHQKCILGDPCTECRRGDIDCVRKYPAEPAFTVTFRQAIRLLTYREAVFVHRKSAIQLTYSEVAHLRDVSCHVDAYVIHQYARGNRGFRLAVDIAWLRPPRIVAATPAQKPAAMLGFV
jgi:hypothetical protein